MGVGILIQNENYAIYGDLADRENIERNIPEYYLIEYISSSLITYNVEMNKEELTLFLLWMDIDPTIIEIYRIIESDDGKLIVNLHTGETEPYV